MPDIRLQELFEKFLGEKMTPDEIRQLQGLIQDEANTALLDKLLQAAYTNKSFSVKDDYELDEVFEELMTRVRNKEEVAAPAIHNSLRIGKGWWIAAASIILVLATAGYLLFFNKAPEQIIALKPQKQNDIIVPGSNKAVLTLANGSTILLDDAQKGTLAQQGNTKIIKSASGNLVYNSGNVPAGEIIYNTLTTPRGGQYEVVLPDGTRAWLNAETSLRFPTLFSGKTREVELNGEAYFEVAKNKTMPFIVSVRQTRVTVLGTHFNVNGYGDEKNILTTLLEGSVKCSNGSADEMLRPGQQAVSSTAANSLAVREVDVNQVTGWKNGFFEFDNLDLSSILRQISRWYDVDIKYQPHGEEVKFGGGISRKLNLSDILRLLETNEIHFKIEGRNIIVNP